MGVHSFPEVQKDSSTPCCSMRVRVREGVQMPAVNVSIELAVARAEGRMIGVLVIRVETVVRVGVAVVDAVKVVAVAVAAPWVEPAVQIEVGVETVGKIAV